MVAAQNDNLAFRWFLSAAEQGDAPAQYNLAARMYLKWQRWMIKIF